MISNIEGQYYDKIILQIMRPEKANVSATDYVAKKLNKNGIVDNLNGVQSPFILSHPAPLTLKVETWRGEIITWDFNAGPYPMPLRKIFNDPANVNTETGGAVTEIQIGY